MRWLAFIMLLTACDPRLGALQAERETATQYIVYGSEGGFTLEYVALAERLNRQGKTVVFKPGATCRSGCTALLGVHKKVVPDDATFGFHASSVGGKWDKASTHAIANIYPERLKAWYWGNASHLIWSHKWKTGKELKDKGLI